MQTTRVIALAAIVLAAACAENDECDYRLYGGQGQLDIAANELRDPSTGICQPFNDPNYGCDDPCQPCPDYATGAAQPDPDWASCYSGCESHTDEASCEAAPGCRAAFAGGAFHQCWAVAPSGPVQGGDCTTFDSHECSRHDDCGARHAVGSPIGSFQSCAPEGTTVDPGSCVSAVTCTTPQPVCPASTIAGRRNGCWTGYCIPLAQCDSLPACGTLAEMECIGRTDCDPIYEGVNCSCNGTSCTCQSWEFQMCEAM